MKRLIVSLALCGIVATTYVAPATAVELSPSHPTVTYVTGSRAGGLSPSLQAQLATLGTKAEEHGYRLQIMVIGDTDRVLDDVIKANLDQRGAALSVLVALDRKTEQGLTPSVRVVVSDELSSYLSPQAFERSYREVFIPERSNGRSEIAVLNLLTDLDQSIQASREAQATETLAILGFLLVFFVLLLMVGARGGGGGSSGFISSFGDSFSGGFDSFGDGGGGGFSGGDS